MTSAPRRNSRRSARSIEIAREVRRACTNGNGSRVRASRMSHIVILDESFFPKKRLGSRLLHVTIVRYHEVPRGTCTAVPYLPPQIVRKLVYFPGEVNTPSCVTPSARHHAHRDHQILRPRIAAGCTNDIDHNAIDSVHVRPCD